MRIRIGVGNAFGIWKVNSNFGADIHVNHYDVTTGRWGTTQEVSAHNLAVPSIAPSIAASPQGHVVAVWGEISSGERDLYGKVYDPVLDTWGTNALIEHASLDHPRVYFNQFGGNAYVGWSQNGKFVFSNYLVDQQSWVDGPTVTITGSSTSFEFAVGRNGEIFALWLRIDGGTYVVESTRYDPITKTWSQVDQFESAGSLMGSKVKIVLDAADNALAMWANNSVAHVARFSQTTGVWLPNESVGGSGATEYAIAPNGSLVWEQSSSIMDVWGQLFQ